MAISTARTSDSLRGSDWEGEEGEEEEEGVMVEEEEEAVVLWKKKGTSPLLHLLHPFFSLTSLVVSSAPFGHFIGIGTGMGMGTVDVAKGSLNHEKSREKNALLKSSLSLSLISDLVISDHYTGERLYWIDFVV